MNVTRRKFLRAGAVSALFAGLTLGPREVAFGQNKRKPVPADSPDFDPAFGFTTAAFIPYVGTEFLLTAKGQRRGTAARLEEVSDFQKDMRDRDAVTHDGQCFSLIFRAPAPKRASRQDIYRVEHGALGSLSLFLVPGPVRDGSVTYEAVINRLA